MPKRARPLIEQWPGPGRIPFYYSRPDLRPPRLNILAADPERATPGYLFVSPSFNGAYRPDSGPYIFDTNGTLIWSGITAAGGAGTADVHGLHVCQYQNTPHLCFWQGQQRGTHGSGTGVIMDSSYRIVRTVSSSSPAGVDFHEFLLTPNNTALITAYSPRFIDALWVLDSCFEQVPLDADDGRAPFRWCASDHLNLSDIPSRAEFLAENKGQTPDRAWDPVHISSVDKTPAGDYLISARHLHTVMLVSQVDGSIIWRLGGQNSSFQLEGFNFTQQQGARFLAYERDLEGSGMMLSLFSNGQDRVPLGESLSKAMVVVLNMQNMTARQISQYGRVPTSATGLSTSQAGDGGNAQVLPNGHILANLGRQGSIAEYPPENDSDPVFFANLLQAVSASPPSKALSWTATNYRAFLYPIPTNSNKTISATNSSTPQAAWQGKPTSRPDLWAYARTPDTLMTFYVSWNGDTRTASYRFHVSKVSVTDAAITPPEDSEFHWAGTWPRTGFETNMTIGSARTWSFAEALDAEGNSLANSSKVRTYVPAKEDWRSCGKWQCFPTVLGDADVLPLIGGSAIGGDGDVYSVDDGPAPAAAGHAGLGLLGLVEHVFALLGLGFLAWAVWSRVAWGGRGWRASAKGYRRVDKGESEVVL